MSTVKIQVIETEFGSEVKVDNKPAYKTAVVKDIETHNLRVLIDLLEIDNVEVVNKKKV